MAAAAGAVSGIESFIHKRELAEVYLLMDHISSAEGKVLPAALDTDPLFANAQNKSWIQQICEITWPPAQSAPVDRALNAAKLIRAKDELNNAAAPATGTTIAFTLMMAEERKAEREGEGGEIEADGVSAVPTREVLAMTACPGVDEQAYKCRKRLRLIVLFLIGWTLMTCWLSWNVATGTSLLNRVNTLEEQLTDGPREFGPKRREPAAKSTPDAGVASSPTPGATATPTPTPTPSPEATVSPTPTPTATPVPFANVPGSRDQLLARRMAAAEGLKEWMRSNDMLAWLLRIDRDGATMEQKVADHTEPLNDPALQWAVVFVGVLAGNVLPIFYGLLGAGTAVVRGIWVAMRLHTLSPRDVLRANVRLALGAVVGACIGLFVGSTGSSAGQPGLFGSVQLSSSALCFVAGFGADHVFAAIDSLLRRVFDPDPNGVKR